MALRMMTAMVVELPPAAEDEKNHEYWEGLFLEYLKSLRQGLQNVMKEIEEKAGSPLPDDCKITWLRGSVQTYNAETGSLENIVELGKENEGETGASNGDQSDCPRK